MTRVLIELHGAYAPANIGWRTIKVERRRRQELSGDSAVELLGDRLLLTGSNEPDQARLQQLPRMEIEIAAGDSNFASQFLMGSRSLSSNSETNARYRR
jgi:hypothetical protein